MEFKRFAPVVVLVALAACATPPPPVVEAPPAPEPEEEVGAVLSGPLGETVASLGDPTQSGLWIKTPLAQVEQPGSVATSDGRRINVTLIPIAGDEGAGSRMSLGAYQALGVSPADLVPVSVTAI